MSVGRRALRRTPPGVSVIPHPSGERNRWTVMAWAGFGQNGKPVRAHRNFRGTPREAIEFGAELRRKITGSTPDPARHTVGSWFESEFLPHKWALAERGDLSPTSVEALDRKFRRYIATHPIARLALAKLDTPAGPAHVVRWFTDVATTPGRNVQRLSPKTMRHILSVMMGGLRHALALGLIDTDPFRRFPADLKPKPVPKGRPSVRSIGSQGQRAIRRVFEGSEIEGEIALALLGLRRGEILGLRLRGGGEDPRTGDVVLDGAQPLVRIRQVVIDDRGGARVKPTPKSATSRRDLALPSWAVRALHESKRRALELRLASGDRWEEHDLLFPSPGKYWNARQQRWIRAGVPGSPQRPNQLYLRFKRHLRELGLDGFDADRIEGIRLHDLRHTFITVLINEVGMRAEDVQRLAGHADLKTTQGYRAEDTEPAARAAAALDELLGD